MALDTHISCIMPCGGYDGIAELAARHADLPGNIDGEREARAMLMHLASRNGVNVGDKGGLFTWGIVGNYVNPEAFVGALKPFWLEAYRGGCRDEDFDGPIFSEHILVFFEREDSDQAQAWEIAYDEGADELSVTHHADLPFCWGQA